MFKLVSVESTFVFSEAITDGTCFAVANISLGSSKTIVDTTGATPVVDRNVLVLHATPSMVSVNSVDLPPR